MHRADYGSGRIRQNLADLAEFGRYCSLVDIADIIDITDITDIVDIADIIVPFPPNYIAKYLEKNYLFLL